MNRKDDQLLRQVCRQLKRTRLQNGYSRDEVYAATKIPVSTIETTAIDIDIVDLAGLCAFYSISLSDFFKQIENNTHQQF